MKNLGIIIPSLNESESLPILLKDLTNNSFINTKFKTSILVIDDGSTDNTPEVLKKFNNIIVISHGYNMGVGAAVRSGLNYFREHKFDYVAKIDADYQHEIHDLCNMLISIEENDADLIYGDRFNGQIGYKMPTLRKLGNRFFTFILNLITEYQINDSQPGMFVGNAAFLKNVFILTDYNYTQQVLYSTYVSGLRFKQLPINFKARKSGNSFIRLSYPIKAIFQIFLMMVIKKPLTFFGIPGIFLIFSSIGISIIQLIQYFNNVSFRPIENVNLVLGTGLLGIILVITSIILKAIDQNKNLNFN